MKVLIIGSGGREHALAWKIDQSEKVSQVYVAPGNAGTGASFINVDIDVMDAKGQLDFAKKEGIDLLVVGPEDPLSAGIVDLFEENGIPAFGPNKECAQFEKSKDFTKKFLKKYDIPTAASFTSKDYEEALTYIKNQSYPLVIKADGLCKGKGVDICQDFNQAKTSLKRMLVDQSFGSEGTTVVIEEFLEGREESLLCFVSNNRLIPMETARDYKKIGSGDKGPNTGGVGVYSPAQEENFAVKKSVKATLEKIEDGLNQEGHVFYGILFIGFMIHEDQAKVLEFNVRFGDPETEVLLPRLESDLVLLMEKALNKTLKEEDFIWSDQVALGVVLVAEGYPGSYAKNISLELPSSFDDDVYLFHNGTTKDKDGKIRSIGGRVLTPVALGSTLEEARTKAYNAVEKIHVPGLTYRIDIGSM